MNALALCMAFERGRAQGLVGQVARSVTRELAAVPA
jgi:hypothetical protein